MMPWRPLPVISNVMMSLSCMTCYYDSESTVTRDMICQ